MKQILLLFLIVIPVLSQAQIPVNGECEYLSSPDDEFGENDFIETEYYKLSRNIDDYFMLRVNAINDDGQKYLTFNMWNATNQFSVNAGDDLKILSKGGEVISLTFPKHIESRESQANPLQGSKYGVPEKFFMASVKIPLDNNQFEELSNTSIEKIRIRTSVDRLEYKISNRKSNVIRDILRCVELK